MSLDMARLSTHEEQQKFEREEFPYGCFLCSGLAFVRFHRTKLRLVFFTPPEVAPSVALAAFGAITASYFLFLASNMRNGARSEYTKGA
jgi:hypothetical protein